MIGWLAKGARWERTVVALIAAAVAYQLFAEPIVGTADNRDWWRVTKQIGVEYLESPGPDATFFHFFQREYRFVPREDVQYLTSQLLLARAALVLNDIFSKDNLFDIRWMGFVNAAAYLAAVAVLLAAFRNRKPWMRGVAGIAALVVFTDVRLVAYFNSFYSEPAQLVFLIAAIGFALLSLDETRSKRSRYYAGFVVTSVLFFFAKTQDLVFCFPFAVIAAAALPTSNWKLRLLPAALFVGLFVWGMKSDAYAVTHDVNIRVAVDEEILKHSKTPEADVQALGDGNYANITFGRIAWFYAKRPVRWWELATRCMHEAFTRAPLGNFELDGGRGESQAFDVFSTWKTKHYPRSLVFWIVLLIGYGAILVAKWRLGDRSDRVRAVVNAMLLAGCILQFIAVVTFEANGTEKHFFIFNVLVDVVIVLSVFEVARLAELWWSRAISSRATD